jgi:hypothetical protein
MTKFNVFYRVPATEKHGSFLSESVVMAVSKADAAAKFLRRYPTYIVTSVIG